MIARDDDVDETRRPQRETELLDTPPPQAEELQLSGRQLAAGRLQGYAGAVARGRAFIRQWPVEDGRGIGPAKAKASRFAPALMRRR